MPTLELDPQRRRGWARLGALMLLAMLAALLPANPAHAVQENPRGVDPLPPDPSPAVLPPDPSPAVALPETTTAAVTPPTGFDWMNRARVPALCGRFSAGRLNNGVVPGSGMLHGSYYGAALHDGVRDRGRVAHVGRRATVGVLNCTSHRIVSPVLVLWNGRQRPVAKIEAYNMLRRIDIFESGEIDRVSIHKGRIRVVFSNVKQHGDAIAGPASTSAVVTLKVNKAGNRMRVVKVTSGSWATAP
ncbi:MAG: hypothetical protein ACE367_25285 [Acidimicrobiales bacterium]